MLHWIFPRRGIRSSAEGVVLRKLKKLSELFGGTVGTVSDEGENPRIGGPRAFWDRTWCHVSVSPARTSSSSVSGRTLCIPSSRQACADARLHYPGSSKAASVPSAFRACPEPSQLSYIRAPLVTPPHSISAPPPPPAAATPCMATCSAAHLSVGMLEPLRPSARDFVFLARFFHALPQIYARDIQSRTRMFDKGAHMAHPRPGSWHDVTICSRRNGPRRH